MRDSRRKDRVSSVIPHLFEFDTGKGVPPMPGETDLHKTLKKEACRWLYRMGYRCIAAEVRLKPLGIIDAVGTGVFRAWHNYLHMPRELPQVCFVECKASRADFLRDQSNDGQMTLCMMERSRNLRSRSRRKPRHALRQAVGLGKFKACLVQPMANLHYILAPQGIVKKEDMPPRWGLLTAGPAGSSLVVRGPGAESSPPHVGETALARTLPRHNFCAHDRAHNSLNHQMFAQQQEPAQR